MNPLLPYQAYQAACTKYSKEIAAIQKYIYPPGCRLSDSLLYSGVTRINKVKTKKMIKIVQKLKDQLWWLTISVDYEYSRIAIGEHDLTDETPTLWLEDKHDFKDSFDECLQVDI